MPEHKFASSLSANPGDVNVDFGHVENQFRVLPNPLTNLFAYAALKAALKVVEIHLEGIDVRIIGKTNPASTTIVGETKTTPAQSKNVLIK